MPLGVAFERAPQEATSREDEGDLGKAGGEQPDWGGQAWATRRPAV